MVAKSKIIQLDFLLIRGAWRKRIDFEWKIKFLTFNGFSFEFPRVRKKKLFSPSLMKIRRVVGVFVLFVSRNSRRHIDK